MANEINKKALMIKGLFFGAIAVLVIGAFLFVSKQSSSTTKKVLSQTTAKVKIKKINYFSYRGEENKNAFDILKGKTKIELDKVGMVSSIDNRKADPSKKEYWAFYVNGKYAQVGPKDYITKQGDKIEWKIEKY